MKEIGAAKFKEHCLSILDEVTDEGLVITKRGRPVAKLIPNDRVFSPSAIENYAVCPQRFLLSDVLRIRAVEEPERTFRIDAIARGNLFHRILQRFHGEWSGNGSASLAPTARERMRQVAAWLGRPMPASTMSGVSGKCARSALRPNGLLSPCPEPIGAPQGISTLQPASSSRSATTRSSVV